MQSLIKKIFAVILITLILSCSLIPALAVNADINAKTTRIASLPSVATGGCGNTQSLSVASTGSYKRLFVVRINSDENKAVLYMYKNYVNMETDATDEYGTFELDNLAGHANGMAIDDDYIYITCWSDENNTNQYKVVRILRSGLWKMYKAKTETHKGELDADSEYVTIMPVVNSDGSIYTEKIVGITHYKDKVDENDNNKKIKQFIIKTPKTTVNDEVCMNFTIARVSDNSTDDDKDDFFVVSDSASEKFRVAFDDLANTFGQDIGYDPNCGLFIVRPYKVKITYVDENGVEKNKFVPTTENAIIWIRLDSLPEGDNRVYRKGNDGYRIIRVNKSTDIFKTYELQSVGIGSNNHMYASVIVKTHSDTSPYVLHPIIKITKPNGDAFLGGSIGN